MQELLNAPVPIVFAACQLVQRLDTGALNVLGIFDTFTIGRLADGSLPDLISIEVVTVWTGGQGEFEQVIRLRDQDSREIAEARTLFTLSTTSQRHSIVVRLPVPGRAEVWALTVARGEVELLRQDFTTQMEPP